MRWKSKKKKEQKNFMYISDYNANKEMRGDREGRDGKCKGEILRKKDENKKEQ